MDGATIPRRQRTEFAKDPERYALHFTDGLTVLDWTACPRKIQARSHWTGPTTCRCSEAPTCETCGVDLEQADLDQAADNTICRSCAAEPVSL